MILIVKADLGRYSSYRGVFSAIDKIFGAANAVDIEIVFKGFVETLFKEPTKMLGAVLTIGCNIGGCNILVKIFLNIGAHLCHKVEYVSGIIIVFFEELVADHLRIKLQDAGKDLYRPAVMLFLINRDDTVDRIAKHGSCWMLRRDVILKADFFQIRKKMRASCSTFGRKEIMRTKSNTGTSKKRFRIR